MPQLDTSTWLTTTLTTTITLFVLMQLKVSSYEFPHTPSIKPMQHTMTDTPWEAKWTKIYSPRLTPPR
uniref:ATP synthase complex subunit 8 n=1 Tax=Bramus lutescens TaxID=3370998 RepID=A0A872ZMJ1_BRALU|nr:ATP synthase F0 subunit 8 [Ellobius lutescens]